MRGDKRVVDCEAHCQAPICKQSWIIGGSQSIVAAARRHAERTGHEVVCVQRLVTVWAGERPTADLIPPDPETLDAIEDDQYPPIT